MVGLDTDGIVVRLGQLHHKGGAAVDPVALIGHGAVAAGDEHVQHPILVGKAALNVDACVIRQRQFTAALAGIALAHGVQVVGAARQIQTEKRFICSPSLEIVVK